MKLILALAFLVTPVFAQGQTSLIASACGEKNAYFDVKLGDHQHGIEEADPEKAKVYFIQDDGSWGEHQHFILRVGLDGVWVGAYKQNSYFSVSVEPGEHHVCANLQSNASEGLLVDLAHFTAERGKIYYFRTRFLGGTSSLYPMPPYLELKPVDSDLGRYLVATYPFGNSQIKK